MSQSVLSLSRVTKTYGGFVLQEVDLEVGPGCLIGVVGPNGSGKSTLMRIVMGLVRQDEGRVEVFGLPMPSRQADVKKRVGFVSDDLRLCRGATIRWHADLVRSLCPTWDEIRAQALADRFQLPWDRPAGELSRGQAVKALVLLALARRPRLLLMDETTAALDTEARIDLLQELERLVRMEALTVLVSSHLVGDLEGRTDGAFRLPRGRWEAIGSLTPDDRRVATPSVANL
jgi:ABC-2 type transport system ATP-binding protein